MTGKMRYSEILLANQIPKCPVPEIECMLFWEQNTSLVRLTARVDIGLGDIKTKEPQHKIPAP